MSVPPLRASHRRVRSSPGNAGFGPERTDTLGALFFGHSPDASRKFASNTILRTRPSIAVTA
jgi:hypothetical protein